MLLQPTDGGGAVLCPGVDRALVDVGGSAVASDYRADCVQRVFEGEVAVGKVFNVGEFNVVALGPAVVADFGGGVQGGLRGGLVLDQSLTAIETCQAPVSK